MTKKKNKSVKRSGNISAYINAQKPKYAAICRKLRIEMNKALPKAASKLYHSIPVWFIGENAVVGFYVTSKKGVNLLFWNGQALKEPELKKEGSFKAAQVQFQDIKEINLKDLRCWLKKAGKKIWDFAALRRKSLKQRRQK